MYVRLWLDSSYNLSLISNEKISFYGRDLYIFSLFIRSIRTIVKSIVYKNKVSYPIWQKTGCNHCWRYESGLEHKRSIVKRINWDKSRELIEYLIFFTPLFRFMSLVRFRYPFTEKKRFFYAWQCVQFFSISAK